MKDLKLFTTMSICLALLVAGCNLDEQSLPAHSESELSSNENKDGGNNNESDKKLLPLKIITHISSILTYSENGSSCQIFEYDKQNRITCIKNTNYGIEGVTIKIFYENDNIKTEETHPDNPQSKIIKTYRHDGMKILVDGEVLINVDNNLQATHIEQGEYGPFYFTYDENGNAMSYTYHAWNDERTQTVNFTYNEDNGIFRNVNTPSWFLTTQIIKYISSENNKIIYQSLYNNCATTADENGHIFYKYEYTYNSDGYPTKVEEVPVGVMSNSSLWFEIEHIEAN